MDMRYIFVSLFASVNRAIWTIKSSCPVNGIRFCVG